MEPLINKKRNVVVYIPYRFSESGAPEFYLQKRDMKAPTHAGIFSMFGGGVEEGESLSDALVREIQEELSIRPKEPKYFTRCERSQGIFHVFIEEVGKDFENSVDVQEGEYGKFLSLDAARGTGTSAIAILAITDISEWLLFFEVK